MRHKRGYFEGKYPAYLIAAYSSYRKSTERVNNKVIAKELGISLRSYYYYKSGKQLHNTNVGKATKEILGYTMRKGELTQYGKVLLRITEKIRKNKNKNKGKIKELSVKEVNKLKDKIKTEIEKELETGYESFNFDS